jgi:hypothetical protein
MSSDERRNQVPPDAAFLPQTSAFDGAQRFNIGLKYYIYRFRIYLIKAMRSGPPAKSVNPALR